MEKQAQPSHVITKPTGSLPTSKSCLNSSWIPVPSNPYLNRVVKGKWNAVTKSIDRRARGTIGGDRLSCNYNLSSFVASLVTLKILLNAAVSENKLFATRALSTLLISILVLIGPN
jgi:hypothetical protein